MYDNSYHFFGMHLIWWIVWIMLVFWIFALPYRIPGQRYRKDSHLDILKRRLALGEITNEEYLEKKNILESDLVKQR
jgi:putative membrane protein